MNSPKVSILLPNLNNRPYLEERIRTIMEQTFTDWELIVVDNYSDDGAWEFFKACARNDKRIKISQAPREGMYANWNNCILLASGTYVYIATSDDTMTPDFLHTMVKALDENPDCDLAHCKLKIIDEKGDEHPTLIWDRFFCTAYFGDLIDKKHIRFAPHDGLLHCGVRTVYTSITQLLIRKSLLEKIGLFLTSYGSAADFEWEMSASLVTNTIHIPEYLATWRVHQDQGTDTDSLNSSKLLTMLLEMIDHAFGRAEGINSDLRKKINRKELRYLYTKEKFRAEILEKKRKIIQYITALKWMLKRPKLFMELYSSQKRFKRPFISPSEPMDFSRKILTKYGFEKNIKIID